MDICGHALQSWLHCAVAVFYCSSDQFADSSLLILLLLIHHGKQAHCAVKMSLETSQQ